MERDREIDLGRMLTSLRNLLAVYVSGLAILIIYLVLLSHGTRLLLELQSPLREVALGSYGLIFTAAWLYSWWRAIKAIRNRLLEVNS